MFDFAKNNTFLIYLMECNKKFERLDKNVTEEISSFKKIKTKDKSI